MVEVGEVTPASPWFGRMFLGLFFRGHEIGDLIEAERRRVVILQRAEAGRMPALPAPSELLLGRRHWPPSSFPRSAPAEAGRMPALPAPSELLLARCHSLPASSPRSDTSACPRQSWFGPYNTKVPSSENGAGSAGILPALSEASYSELPLPLQALHDFHERTTPASGWPGNPGFAMVWEDVRRSVPAPSELLLGRRHWPPSSFPRSAPAEAGRMPALPAPSESRRRLPVSFPREKSPSGCGTSSRAPTRSSTSGCW